MTILIQCKFLLFLVLLLTMQLVAFIRMTPYVYPVQRFKATRMWSSRQFVGGLVLAPFDDIQFLNFCMQCCGLITSSVNIG
jgi:hypothetical protein